MVNNYFTNINTNTVDVSVENNCELLPIGVVAHKCTKNIIKDAYSAANPNPLSINAASPEEILALSAFLQHPTWPLCTKNNQCQKPNVVHRPDVCVVFKEVNVPLRHNKFHIPLLICEVEGAKASWDEGEQQSKAIEEACYGLAFVPENYILFFYARRCELVSCKRNPHTGSIEIECETVYLQQDGDALRDKLIHICNVVTKILVKQLTSCKSLIELTIPRFRQRGVDGIDKFHPYANVCNGCWYIHTLDFGPQMLGLNPNNIPQFE